MLIHVIVIYLVDKAWSNIWTTRSWRNNPIVGKAKSTDTALFAKHKLRMAIFSLSSIYAVVMVGDKV